MSKRYIIDKETNTMAKMTPENIVRFLDGEQKDELYRMLWIEYVKQDIESYLEENGDDYSFASDERKLQNAVETAANRYVYNGDYDCNLDYWSNIENLLKEIDKEETEEK